MRASFQNKTGNIENNKNQDRDIIQIWNTPPSTRKTLSDLKAFDIKAKLQLKQPNQNAFMFDLSHYFQSFLIVGLSHSCDTAVCSGCLSMFIVS